MNHSHLFLVNQKPLKEFCISSNMSSMNLNQATCWTVLVVLCLQIPCPLIAENQGLQNTLYLSQQESEERYRSLRAELEDAQAANLALLKRMEAIEKENRVLRAGLSRLPASAATEVDLKKMADELVKRIKQVDQKRSGDNIALVQQVKELWKALEKVGKPVPRSVPASKKTSRIPKKIAEMTVQPGYTISAIAEAYRLDGYEISIDDILEANPSISDPRKIKVGDVIIIPIEW